MQNRSRCGFGEAAARQKEGKDEMIISASRRTDIPACYGQWMIARLRAGEVLVPNPYNASRISRVALSPGNVDCIVFWTKNAAPMLPLWLRLVIVVWSLAIVASTMLVKQHMVIDAVTALPAAAVCWLLAGLVNFSSLAAKFS